jgi:hypothetical protein
MKTLVLFSLLLATPLLANTSNDEYPYAVAYSKCAPWDGPAVGIVLMKTKEECPPAAGFPYAEVSLWKELPVKAPKKIELKDGASVGSAINCKERGSCDSLSAVINVQSFEEGKAVSGNYRLVWPDGTTYEGKFQAPWCTKTRLKCG